MEAMIGSGEAAVITSSMEIRRREDSSTTWNGETTHQRPLTDIIMKLEER